MTPWKIVLMTLVLLVPGGSLLLLAFATAKALGSGKVPGFQHTQPAPVPVVVNGGKV